MFRGSFESRGRAAFCGKAVPNAYRASANRLETPTVINICLGRQCAWRGAGGSGAIGVMLSGVDVITCMLACIGRILRAPFRLPERALCAQYLETLSPVTTRTRDRSQTANQNRQTVRGILPSKSRITSRARGPRWQASVSHVSRGQDRRVAGRVAWLRFLWSYISHRQDVLVVVLPLSSRAGSVSR